jgi:hypothetical protein
MPAPADWRDFLQTLEHATTADLPALWDSLSVPEYPINGGMQKSPRHRLLMERWTELDPTGALAFIEEKPLNKQAFQVLIFQTWARLDPEAALAALKHSPHPEIQVAGAAGFLVSYLDQPAELLNWAKRLTWVKTNLLEKQDLLAVCPDDLLRTLLEIDRPGLFEIAAHLPDWFRQHLDHLVLFQQAATDLPAVLASLKAQAPTQKEIEAIASDLGMLAETQPASALDILEVLHTASNGKVLLTAENSAGITPAILKYLVARDPQEARMFLEKYLSEEARRDFCQNTYPELFASNPAAALVIAQALPFMSPDTVHLPVFKDRATALAILPEAPPSWRRDQAVLDTLQKWQNESPAAARAWLDALPAGEWRDRAAAVLQGQGQSENLLTLEMQGITLQHHPDQSPSALEEAGLYARRAAEADPAGTLALLGEWAPGSARQAALEKAASVAAGQNTAQALAWAQQIPDPSAQAEAIQGLMAVWAKHEPLAASEWLPTLAPGPVREAAVDRFAETISSLDPAAGFAWAATLTDPTARAARLETTYWKWAAEDPAAARATAQATPGFNLAVLQQHLPPAAK